MTPVRFKGVGRFILDAHAPSPSVNANGPTDILAPPLFKAVRFRWSDPGPAWLHRSPQAGPRTPLTVIK